jgi:hypothetical protein
MQIVVEEVIRAPRPVTFAVATDVRAWPSRMSSIRSTELLTREPVGAGTRFRETRHIHGSLATGEMTFAEFEPPGLFVLTAQNHGARYRIEHIFEEVPHGTGLTVRFNATPLTTSARLMSPLALLFRNALHRQLKADIADLKASIEGRDAHISA